MLSKISFLVKVWLQQALCWYYYIQLDFPKYYRHADKWVQLFESKNLRNDSFSYLMWCNKLCTALFLLVNPINCIKKF